MIQENLTNEFLIDINKTIEIVNTKKVDWNNATKVVFNDYMKNIRMFEENHSQIRYTEFYYHHDFKEGFFDTPNNKKYLTYMFYKLAKLINKQKTHQN